MQYNLDFETGRIHFYCKHLTATSVSAFLKKTRNESKLFYVVIKIMPQAELALKPESQEAKQISESTTRFQRALYTLDLIPALPKLTQRETFFCSEI